MKMCFFSHLTLSVVHCFQVPHSNCGGHVTYVYKINKRGYQNTSSAFVELYLDGNEKYNFSVQAANSAQNKSDFVTISGISPQLGKLNSTVKIHHEPNQILVHRNTE